MSLDFTGLGEMDAEERLEEAGRILKIIESNDIRGRITLREEEFLSNMEATDVVSPKQLAWLRDLLQKYL